MTSAIAQLDEVLRANDLALSRTATSGLVDVSVSSLKRKALVDGDELLQTISRNRNRIARFIVAQSGHHPTTPYEVTGLLLAMAFLTNDEISPGGLFRSWEYKPQVPSFSEGLVAPEKIPQELHGLAEQVVSATRMTPKEDLIGHIGGFEWDIGIGPLHPFYDGCGRISRYFSAMMSFWLDLPLVRHESRSDYMARASEGREAFIRYYVTRPRTPHDAA